MAKGKIVIQFDTEADYIGASTQYSPLPDEDWERGNDLADGKISDGALERIERDIRDVLAGKRS